MLSSPQNLYLWVKNLQVQDVKTVNIVNYKYTNDHGTRFQLLTNLITCSDS